MAVTSAERHGHYAEVVISNTPAKPSLNARVIDGPFIRPAHLVPKLLFGNALIFSLG
ncbi:MAG TPA: hypothetical protein VGI60_09390 [Chthoniobacterales bacterium]